MKKRVYWHLREIKVLHLEEKAFEFNIFHQF